MNDRTHGGASPKAPLSRDATALDGESRRAWTDAMAVRPFGDAYLVEDAAGTHFVALGEGRCSCRDAGDEERCKHLRRVAIEINMGHVPPPTGRSVPCQGCDAEVAISVADDPPHLCVTCALEPGDLVVDAADAETPLLVVSRPGPPAAAVVVPDADCTVADYPGNDAYPADAPVVEAVYPLSVSTDRPPRRYLFPVPRLERPTDDADEQTVLVGPRGTDAVGERAVRSVGPE